MSDTSQGTGWWQASDGKWYAPEAHPSAAPNLPMPPQAPTNSPAAKKRKRWPWITLGAVVLLFILIGVFSGSPKSTSSKSAGPASTPPAAASSSTSSSLTPQAFFRAMNARSYPPGVSPNSANSWGSFVQYTYSSSSHPVDPLTESSAGADHALGALGGPMSPNLATHIDYYVFPNTQDAAAFYASPPTGTIDFPFEGKAPLSGVTLPSNTEAFSVTECGSNGNGNTEVSPTSCSRGGSPFVDGTVLYALHGFIVTAVGHAGSLSLPSAVKGAEKSISTLKSAVSFAQQVEAP